LFAALQLSSDAYLPRSFIHPDFHKQPLGHEVLESVQAALYTRLSVVLAYFLVPFVRALLSLQAITNEELNYLAIIYLVRTSASGHNDLWLWVKLTGRSIAIAVRKETQTCSRRGMMQ
jgi:hypothetical protein